MYEYRVIRSDRRTLALEITRDGELLVRAPRRVTDRQIQGFVQKHNDWLRKHYRPKSPVVPFSDEEAEQIKQKARTLFPLLVDEWAARMGVVHTGVTVRMQHTRWGSCSGKNHINLNALLVLFPTQVLDYVIVHELAHCFEHNHSARFWKLVETNMPDYKQAKQWLKEYGVEFSRRIP